MLNGSFRSFSSEITLNLDQWYPLDENSSGYKHEKSATEDLVRLVGEHSAFGRKEKLTAHQLYQHSSQNPAFFLYETIRALRHHTNRLWRFPQYVPDSTSIPEPLVQGGDDAHEEGLTVVLHLFIPVAPFHPLDNLHVFRSGMDLVLQRRVCSCNSQWWQYNIIRFIIVFKAPLAGRDQICTFLSSSQDPIQCCRSNEEAVIPILTIGGHKSVNR